MGTHLGCEASDDWQMGYCNLAVPEQRDMHASIVAAAVNTNGYTVAHDHTNSLVRHCCPIPSQMNYSTYKYDNYIIAK